MRHFDPKSSVYNGLQASADSPEPPGTDQTRPDNPGVDQTEKVNNTTLMLDSNLANEILRNIALSGSTATVINPIIGGHLNHILNLSSGAARLQTNVIKRFSLILSQPAPLAILNPFIIRCVLCKRVISYPAWYYSVRYAVNHFHYFVCFDRASADKPSTKCYRRNV